jgi:hypothetical protein
MARHRDMLRMIEGWLRKKTTFHFRKASRTWFGGNGLVRSTPRISAPM